ncbi:MAG: class I SAM-dependent methyltransferase [Candidatus Latescibacterota bacterium]
MAKKNHIRSTFDEAYYRRYYGDPQTAVITKEDVNRLAMFVVHYLAYLHMPVRHVLDLGCGVGMWGDVLSRHDANIVYTGVEISPFLCDKYGWVQGSIVNFTSRSKFDLVICQGVLPYLGGPDAKAAIENLATLCRGALYLEAVTEEDRDNGVYDVKKTDCDIHLRKAHWYHKRLRRHFIACGGGLFFPRSTIL